MYVEVVSIPSHSWYSIRLLLRNRFVSCLLLAAPLAIPSSARAGGYDTPILYTARHMGMGGTAVSYVDDPSALFHNPAGLGNIGKASLIANFSPVLAFVEGSPATPDQNVESDLVFAPFFLAGGAARVTDFMTVGFAVYPGASAAATYNYPNFLGENVEDKTRLVFLEISPGVGFNIDAARLNLGISYRITQVTLERTQQVTDGATVFDLPLSGWDFAGFRVGAQWEAVEDHFWIGASYRHKTTTTVSADEGGVPEIFGGRAFDLETEFTLPSRLSFGARGEIKRFAASADLEIGYNSQNDVATLTGLLDENDPGSEIALDNVFEWKDQVTFRLGVEYNVDVADGYVVSPRLGYIFDGETASRSFPTAFGTPPAPTNSLTAGVGLDGGAWETNVAYAYRFGEATVTGEDIAAGDGRQCIFCGDTGTYNLKAYGVYVDFSYDFE